MKVIETAECTYVCVKHLCAPEKWIQDYKKKNKQQTKTLNTAQLIK